MKYVLSVTLAVLLLTAGHSATAQPLLAALTYADVVRFVAMGMPDQAVNNLINEAQVTQFDLSPSAVSGLTDHGVSPAVIATMRQPSASGASPLRASPAARQLPELKTTLDLTPSGMQPLTADSLQSALLEGERTRME
jgi:hypothetical protein